jgi:hypothetical protein
VSRHRESGISELSLSPPCPHRGVETEIEAFAVGFAYAKAAIDGRVSGIDISKL